MRSSMQSSHSLWISAGVIALAIIFLAAEAPANADDNAPTGRVTFYKDVLPILQTSCQDCHRPSAPSNAGMMAPMAFMSYQEVRPWAKAISKQTAQRTMPPWHASAIHHGQFANERTLTDAEIATLARWASTGAVPGNKADAPEPRVFEDGGTGWSIGVPDLIVSMPERYFVPDDVEDQYASFQATITEEQLPEPRYIKGIEYKNGSEAVHHIIASPLGGSAPGTGASYTAAGFGRVLNPGTVVTFQMHYHKEPGPGTGVWDQTSIGLTFHPKDIEIKYVSGGGPANLGNMRFEIPPGNSSWAVGAAHTYQQETLITGFLPHMHLRGKSAKYTAFYPDGTSEILLDVPNYDFNWQTGYRYKEPKVLPTGTRVEVIATFDNSEERAVRSNFNAERAIRFGGPTTDEMMLGWITTYVPVDDDSTQ